MHHAVRTEGNNKEIITLLLDYGADRTIAGENGTALDVRDREQSIGGTDHTILSKVAEGKGSNEIAELLRTYTPVPKTKDRTPRKQATTTEKALKIVLVGDPKCSCKTQVCITCGNWSLSAPLRSSVICLMPSQVITSYVKSNPKMRLLEGTLTFVGEDGIEKPMQAEGEVTIDNKSVHVVIIDGPNSKEAKDIAYAGTDLFLVLFSIIDPDSVRGAMKVVRTYLLLLVAHSAKGACGTKNGGSEDEKRSVGRNPVESHLCFSSFLKFSMQFQVYRIFWYVATKSAS